MRHSQGITRAGGQRSCRRSAAAGLLALLACAGVSLLDVPFADATSCAGGRCTVPFSATGSLQEWQVPVGVTSATFEVKAAGGGGSDGAPGRAAGGSGAKVTSTLSVGEKTKLKLVVGIGGRWLTFGEAFGGGGSSSFAIGSPGGGGGGGTFVFSEGGSLLIAAGGGGGAGGYEAASSAGGNGGELGAAGAGNGVGGGGGAGSGGGGSAGEHAKAGQGPTTSTAIQGKGGEGGNDLEGGGGGGGGFYGGGGGGSNGGAASGGGGGGSSTVSGGSSTTIKAGEGGAGGKTDENGHGGEVGVAFSQPTMGVALVPSSETPAIGEPVTYTATVSPVPTSGTVAFEEGGSAIAGCAAQGVSTTTGRATCTTEYHAAGAHGVRGVYSGSADAVYRSATSAEAQTATPEATSTTLQTSSASPKAGATVIYTATVSPTPSGGSVSFSDDAGAIAGCQALSVNTASGVATCEVTYASAGSHSITAAFSGSEDHVFQPSSTASATTVTVSAPSAPVAAPTVTPAVAAVAAAGSSSAPVVLTRAPQPLINTRLLTIFFRCGSSPCSGSAAITVRLPRGRAWHLKGTEASAAGGTPSRIRVAVPAQLRQDVRRYLRHHRRYRVKLDVSVTLTSAGGARQTTQRVLGIWTLPGLR